MGVKGNWISRGNQGACVRERENDMPPTEREAVSHCVPSPWRSATRRGIDQWEINLTSCLTALCPPQKLRSRPHLEGLIELHFPFDEQQNGLLVALVILSPVEVKPCLNDSKRYRTMYYYNCPENAIMAFTSALSHVHVIFSLMLIFIQIQIWAFRKWNHIVEIDHSIHW